MNQRLQVLKHRWQRDWSTQPQERMQKRDVWRRLRLGAFLLLFVGLLALFVYQLWFRPIQTPFVAITAPTYGFSIPPNAFAQEDLQGLADLNDQSIELLDTTSAWRSTESGLAAFDRQLHAASKLGSKTGAVIIYVSMHGVVDGAGQPALIPPGGSPLRSDTWLKLGDLLERIKAERLPESWHKLLVLDCNRLSVNWRIGLLANGFADRLPEVVAAHPIPNLVILNSTSPGEQAWSSSDLSGSVFGHFLRLGLAGAADDPSEGGNGDHRVSVHELTKYLQTRVDSWVEHNRADRQRPMLVPEDARDFTVVWSLNKTAQKRLTDNQPSTQTSETVARGINTLWEAHDRLAAQQPNRFDPLAWRDFEHKLLWLDEAATSGVGYKTPARAMLKELQDYISAADDRIGKLAKDATIFNRADLFTDRDIRRPTVAAHSLPLAEFVGSSSDASPSQLAARLQRFESAPSETAADELLGGAAGRNRTPQWIELQYIRLMRQQLPAAVWNQPALVARAVSTQLRSERAAVPDDERVKNWTLPLVAAGDQAARQARDRLFAGDASALGAAEPFWSDAERRYTQAEKLGKTVAAAFEVRDRVYAEAPYLAEWLARPLPSGNASDKLDAEINDTLLPLIHANHELAEMLAAGPPAGAEPIAEAPALEQQAHQLRDRLDRLEKAFADECDRLGKMKKADGSSVREIQAALALPLCPAHERSELRRLLADSSKSLIAAEASSAKETKEKSQSKSATSEKESATAKISQPDLSAAEYLHRSLIAWQQNPALSILAPPSSSKTAEPAGSLKPAGNRSDKQISPAEMMTLQSAAQSAQVRELLEALPARVKQLRDDAEASSGEGKEDAVAHAQSSIAQAEQVARAAASFNTPALDYDPIRRARQWDLQQMLLWHASRALDDFWGSADNQGDPFFAMAAADYLRGAQAIGEVEPALLTERNRLAKLLERRRTAARAAVHVAASDVLLLKENESATIKLGVQATADAAKEGAPTERVALFVRDAQGRIDGTSQFLDLSSGAADHRADGHLDIKVPTAALVGRGPQLEAVALLRTNAFTAPFLLHETGGARIDFKPYNYGSPTVTVAGRSRKRASIIFILDCSNSMTEVTDMEGPGGVQRISRMEAAKIALHEMLSQLAAEGDARVGVMFYGHRVGWNLKKPQQMLQQTDYARPIPDDLRPSEDVETVLPLGRFDSVVAGGVFDLMKTLKPWGETPLYLSVIQAINQFSTDEPGTEKSIVVITDGANYQFNSPSPKRRDDVMTAMGDHKIPVDIVGFGIPAAEQAEASREFSALAEQTGGSFTPVSSGTSLVKSLETLLGPKLFTVSDGAGQQIGRGQVGTAVTVNPKPIGPHSYSIAMGPLTDEIQLSGGEAAELLLGADGHSLESVGFDKGEPRFGPLVETSGSPSGLRLGVHRPVHEAGGVRFPISIQRADRQFAPRPVESWIEVTPILDERRAAPSKYVFYDPNFEPGTTVPVLNWLAADWPTAAKQASVIGWIKYDRTPPDWVVKIGDVANQVPANGTGHTLSGLPGLTYQVRSRPGDKPGSPLRVAVIERHSDDAADVAGLRVEIIPQPVHVVHRFDAENHLVVHIFELDEASQQAVNNYELHFTSRESTQKGALQLADPIARDVTDSSDVIRTLK
ncbi:MAG TPA: vWA domain-containing protein [Pirellulales bacterium]|nr:vWA domain-containing protein [Pirellulales bacterium]